MEFAIIIVGSNGGGEVDEKKRYPNYYWNIVVIWNATYNVFHFEKRFNFSNYLQ